jgi:Ca2+-binding RTX toxin-like protein
MALIEGTALGDLINATSSDGDEIRGLGDDDTIYGGVGDDTINGNDGSDLMYADSNTETAAGNDSIFGGSSGDTLVGARFGFGGDTLNGNKGNDVVVASQYGGDVNYGGQDLDTLYGNLGGHDLIGNLGNDLIYMGAQGGDRGFGNDGDDTLVGGNDDDNMSGEAGEDEFVFQPGQEVEILGVNLIEGGYGGADTITDFNQDPGGQDIIKIAELDFGASVTVEDVTGGALITIEGTAGSDAESAAQTIFVEGTSAAGLLAVGSNDIEVNGVVINTTNATTNVDGSYTYGVLTNVSGKTISGTDVADDIGTSANPNSQFDPTINNDTIDGNGGNDRLDGLAGDDIIAGDGGDDTIWGNTGEDTLTGGGDADDFAWRSLGDAVDTITDFSAFEGDQFRITASGFGGTLFAGGNVVTPGFFSTFAAAYYFSFIGAPPADAFTLGFAPTAFATGLSVFYYDLTGGGLYFDADGGATGVGFVKVAELDPAPIAGNQPFAVNTPTLADSFILV